MKKEESELAKISGLGPTTLEKLAEVGVTTLMSLAVSSPADIAVTAGLSEKAARKFINESREMLSLGFEQAKVYAKKRELIKKIPTGAKEFDEMLAGGLESGLITEVYGQYGSSKTQLSHLLTVKGLAENPENKTIFIDTENTFRPDRIKDFCEGSNMDYEDVMNRIFVARAFNAEHQILLIEELEKILQKDNTYRVLIIDSLTSHFRAEMTGRGQLATRQQLLNKHMHRIMKLADLYNMVVLVTNQVQSNPAQMYGDPITPIGGNIVGHNSAIRIYLRRNSKGLITAKLIDSPNLPMSECKYIVTRTGLEDEK